VHRNRDEDLATDARRAPASGHELAERLYEAALAVVLESVDAGARRPVERGTPLQLNDASGRVSR
jgi:hypothetical protein